MLGLAQNPARGTCFWSLNTECVARRVLTEKARPCTDLNLFNSIFTFSLFFYSSVGFGWEFCRTVIIMQSALCFVIRMRLVIRQSKLPACLAEVEIEVQLAHESTLAFLPQDWWNRQIKWIKSVSVGSYQYKNQVNGEFFAYLWVILLYFSLESRLIPTVLELGQVRLFWKLIRSRTLQLSHSWEYFPSSLALNSNIWRLNVDFRQKWYILWSQCS